MPATRHPSPCGVLVLALVCLCAPTGGQVIPQEAVRGNSSRSVAGSVILSDEELFGDTAPPDTVQADAARAGRASGPGAGRQTADSQSPVEGPHPLSATIVSAPLRLLIARPGSFSYATDRKSAWIAPIVEFYLALRLGTIPGVYVVPPDAASTAVAGHRDHSVRIPRQTYRDAAVRLGATHIVFSEYETIQSGDIKLHLTVGGTGGKERTAVVTLAVAGIESSLEQCVSQIAALLGVSGGGAHGTLIGPNGKKARKLGAALVWEGANNEARAAHAAQQCRELYRSDPAMALARYAAAVMWAESGAMRDAFAEVKGLLAGLFKGDARMSFEAARYARLAGEIAQAAAFLARAPADDAFKPAVMMELAEQRLTEGRPREALREYDGLLAVDPGNATAKERRVYVLLKLDRSGDEVLEAAREAAAGARSSVSSVLEAAASDCQRAGDLEAAAQGYLLAARAAPENTDVLVKLAAVYEQQGRRIEAAEVYEGLAALAPSVHRGLLDRAAAIYREQGATHRAVNAYETFLGVRDEPEAALSLARLLFEAGDCARVRQALQGLRDKHYTSPAVDSLAAACGRDTVAPRISIRGGTITLQTGRAFVDPGADANDDLDGDLTAFIKTSSTVDNAYPGTYDVVYTVADRSGNTATARRTVIVEGQARPELAVLARSKRRRPVRLAVGFAGGVIAAGSVIAGVALDSRIGSLQESYDRSRDYDEVRRLHDEMEWTAHVRSALYAVAGASAAGVALTITIPAVRRAKAGHPVAMGEVEP